MKKYLLTIAFVAVQISAVAQTVNVHFKNGQQIQYPASNVDYVDFSAKAADPTVSAGQVVDLGLSVYWASCNLGAEKPEEYGDYYAWGETKTKDKFWEDTYSFFDNNTQQYINIGDNISGTEYDAATANLGAEWRMPTKEEMQELIENCTWVWQQLNGINGYLITGKNGNSIFMPAAGDMVSSVITENASKYLLYYTGTISSVQSNSYNLLAGSSSKFMSTANRWHGYTIRPVTKNLNAGGGQEDHSQDHLVTDKVTASFTGGAYSSINGKIQSGSQLNVRFSNGSSETVTLTKIQLGDAATGSEGNNMLNSEVEVAAGEAKNYTVTVGAGGLTTPVIRFTYRYNKKNYVAEATWSM